MIFYNKKRDQSVIGIGEVSKHIHEKSPIPGRTNSTAIEVYFEKEIEPVSLGTLNKHPKLKICTTYKKTQNKRLQACHRLNLSLY